MVDDCFTHIIDHIDNDLHPIILMIANDTIWMNFSQIWTNELYYICVYIYIVYIYIVYMLNMEGYHCSVIFGLHHSQLGSARLSFCYPPGVRSNEASSVTRRPQRPWNTAWFVNNPS
jgi:hypothetical protein